MPPRIRGRDRGAAGHSRGGGDVEDTVGTAVDDSIDHVEELVDDLIAPAPGVPLP
jgi:hypothetical protein